MDAAAVDGTRNFLLLQGGLLGYVLSTAFGIAAARGGDRRHLRFSRAALVPAAAAHLLLLVFIGIEHRRLPVAHLQETFLFLAAALTLTALAIDFLGSAPVLLLGTAPVSTVTVLIAVVLPSSSASADREWLTLWTGLHVILTLLALVSFALAFVAGILFLLEQSRLKSREQPPLPGWMPPLEKLHAWMLHFVTGGLFLLTAGIVVGYLYARSRFGGRDWRLDPKILVTTGTWAAYTLVMAMSFLPAFKGRRTAIGTVACFLLVAVTLWGGVFWNSFHRFG